MRLCSVSCQFRGAERCKRGYTPCKAKQSQRADKTHMVTSCQEAQGDISHGDWGSLLPPGCLKDNQREKKKKSFFVERNGRFEHGAEKSKSSNRCFSLSSPLSFHFQNADFAFCCLLHGVSRFSKGNLAGRTYHQLWKSLISEEMQKCTKEVIQDFLRKKRSSPCGIETVENY